MKKYTKNVFAVAALVLVVAWIALAFAANRAPSGPEGTVKKLETALRKHDEDKFLDCYDSELRQMYLAAKRRESGLTVWDFYGSNLEDVSDIRMLVTEVEYDEDDSDSAIVKYISVERYKDGETPDSVRSSSMRLVRKSGKWIINY